MMNYYANGCCYRRNPIKPFEEGLQRIANAIIDTGNAMVFAVAAFNNYYACKCWECHPKYTHESKPNGAGGTHECRSCGRTCISCQKGTETAWWHHRLSPKEIA